MKSVILVYTTLVISIHVSVAVIRINATLGSTVTLECQNSQKQTITWRGPYEENTIYAETTHINTNLPEDLHSRVFITIANDTKKSYLRIVDVHISDQGTYTCSNYKTETNQIEEFNLVLPALLNSNDPSYYRYLLFDSISKKLIVGFMNGVSFIDILDTTVQIQSTPFQSEQTDINYCTISNKALNCQNHIRFITRKNDETLILFGTNAYSPTRYEFNMTDGTYIKVGGAIPSSKDPFDNFTAIYVSSNNPDNQALMYYAAANEDPKISRPIYETDGTVNGYMTSIVSTKWLKAPQFVGSFDVVDRVLFFFRETAIEVESEDKLYSRVAKVCKSDIGGNRKLRKTWTGYQKAKLDCSIPGEFPTYFDVIQDVVTKDNIFYGLFTSGTGMPASAICAFKLSEIERVFNGPFKTQASSTSIWTQATSVPTPRPGQCTNDSMSTPDDVLTFIGDHPLMHESVQPLYDKPIFILDNEELQILTLHDDMSDLVFYAASNTGKVYKLFSKGEETYVSSTYSPTKNSEVIWSMQQYDDSLYIGTDYLVRQIKIINCEQYRWIDSCVKDPHCAWINNGSLLKDTSVDMKIPCYYRCRSLTFVNESGLNSSDVYTHDNYNQAQTEYRCPPEKPKCMQVITVNTTTIEIRWVAGFDGGIDQTFVLEYRLSKTTSWNTFYPNFTGFKEDPQYFKLSGLSSCSIYDIQMYARNTVGNSAKTDIISVSTSGTVAVQDKNEDELTSREIILLGITTFCSLLSIILSIILLVIVAKKYCKEKEKRKIQGPMSNNDTTSQNVYISSDQPEDSSNRWTNEECDMKQKDKNGYVETELKYQSSTVENSLPPIHVSYKPDSSNRWTNEECDMKQKDKNGYFETGLKYQSSTVENSLSPIHVSNNPDFKKKKKKEKKKSKKHNKENSSAELINGSVNSNKTVSDVQIDMDSNINKNEQY